MKTIELDIIKILKDNKVCYTTNNSPEIRIVKENGDIIGIGKTFSSALDNLINNIIFK